MIKKKVFVLVVFFCVVMCRVEGQILLPKEKIKALAEQYMIDYISERNFNTDRFANIARGEYWNLALDDEQDFLAAYAEYTKSDKSLVLTSFLSYDRPSMFRGRNWAQRLTIGDDVYIRSGFVNRFDGFVKKKGSISSTSPDVRTVENGKGLLIDFYWVPVSCVADMATDIVGSRYGVDKYIENCRFLTAEKNDKGQIVGYWHLGSGERGSVSEVTFSTDAHHVPVSTVMRRVKDKVPDEKNVKDFSTFSVLKTEWGEFRNGKEKAWMPKRFHMADFSWRTGKPSSEWSFVVTWKFGDDVNEELLPDRQTLESPLAKVPDWREPLRVTFNENWSLTWRDIELLEEMEN